MGGKINRFKTCLCARAVGENVTTFLEDIYLFIDCRFPFFFTCRTTEIACLLGVCLYNTVTINNPSGAVQLDALIDIDRISGSCNKIEYNSGPTRLVSLLLLMFSITDFLTNRTVACWLDARLHSVYILFLFFSFCFTGPGAFNTGGTTDLGTFLFLSFLWFLHQQWIHDSVMLFITSLYLQLSKEIIAVLFSEKKYKGNTTYDSCLVNRAGELHHWPANWPTAAINTI